jgi:NAD(P)-dependent dehydrogenase (short-subunit alcohol dehydrogenase family)
MRELVGQVGFVTGGGRGLGRAFAVALGSAGADVAVAARSADQLAETCAMLERVGRRAMAFPLDVSDSKAVTTAIATIERTLGSIDVLVNCAGVMAPIGRDWEVDPAEWWRTMEVNVYGAFLCWRAVLPGMMSRRRGRIINITSSAAGKRYPLYSAYGASKAALSHASASLADAVREFGIQVFAYCPGFVRTDMTEALADAPLIRDFVHDGFRRALDEGRSTPIERSVGVLLLLARGDADALSGQQIDVNDDVSALIEQQGKPLVDRGASEELVVS